jgi:hypothetical protein
MSTEEILDAVHQVKNERVRSFLESLLWVTAEARYMNHVYKSGTLMATRRPPALHRCMQCGVGVIWFVRLP